jgi:acetoacetate decarboxylase
MPVAVGTMGYKYHQLDAKALQESMETTPNYLLKIIPHVNGKDKSVCQLVKYFLKDMNVKGAWTGPAELQLFAHALAPVAELPVRKVISGTHLIVDLTLGFGEVVYDYLAD